MKIKLRIPESDYRLISYAASLHGLSPEQFILEASIERSEVLTERCDALDELAAQAQALGMGYGDKS